MRQQGWKRLTVLVVLAGVALFGLAQAVPYGRSHANPPVTREPRWDSPQTRELAKRACFDCHSNSTTWPWYSNIAPVSWLVQRDVNDGRRVIDFSRWDQPQGEVHDAIEAIGHGMPPWYYTLMHSRAKLSKAEQDALRTGLQKTFAADPPIGGGGG